LDRITPSLPILGIALLAGLVELLGGLVVLRRELVYLGLDLGDGRRRRGACHGAEDGQPADRHQPGRDRDTAAEQGLYARWPRAHVPTTLLVIPRVIARLPGSTQVTDQGTFWASVVKANGRFNRFR